MALLKLSAPWQIYYRELCALFAEDKEIHIIYDQDDQIINIYVDNEAKADALDVILPPVKSYGNIELEINIVPSNKCRAGRASKSTYEDIFYGNPIVKDIVTVDIMSNPITYVIFKKEVVQYYNDDLGDAHGICSTLYQDIADRIFEEHEGVFFCTDIAENIVSNSSSPLWIIPFGNFY